MCRFSQRHFIPAEVRFARLLCGNGGEKIKSAPPTASGGGVTRHMCDMSSAVCTSRAGTFNIGFPPTLTIRATVRCHWKPEKQ
jgi:hypothetical protein